jgi:hypothetical protein
MTFYRKISVYRDEKQIGMQIIVSFSRIQSEMSDIDTYHMSDFFLSDPGTI